MKKNKLNIFILITIILTVSCLSLGGCISERQIDKFAEKYPGGFDLFVKVYFSKILMLIDKATIAKNVKLTPEQKIDKQFEIEDKWNTKLFEWIIDEYDFDNKQKVTIVGTKNNLKTIEATSTFNTATISATQGISTGGTQMTEEDLEDISQLTEDEIIDWFLPKDSEESTVAGEEPAETQEEEIINLQGYYINSPTVFTLTIDLNTGKVTGNWSEEANDNFCSGTITGEINKETLELSMLLTGVCRGQRDFDVYPSPMEGILDKGNRTADGVQYDENGKAWAWYAE